MAATMARGGVQSMNSPKLLKTVLQKSYHKESSSSSCSDLKGVVVGLKGEEEKDIDCQVDGCATGSWWIPHHQTGIYYPYGHEKVMEDVPMGAAKSKDEVHRFSSNDDDVPDHLFTSVD